MNTIILKKKPLLEISFDNTHIQIVDFKNEVNNEVFQYNELINIELVKNTIKIESFEKNVRIEIDEKSFLNASNIVTEVKRLKLSKEILYPKEEYSQESFINFKNRYNGFGKNLYSELKNENLKIFKKLRFYKKLKEKEDSFAEYIFNGNSFAIHLCFYSELIIVSNNKKYLEIGTCEKEGIQKAIKFILNELIK